MTVAEYPDLAGKVAVVTGGSRGIGAETARRLAASGAWVAIVGRDQKALDGVVDQITAAGGTVVAFAADVTDGAALEGVRAEVTELWGPADILAAFAGGQG